MPVNVSPEYAQAEKKFLEAQTEEDRLFFLEEMIRNAPAHKGGEALRANLRTRYKKFKEKLESQKKASGSGGKVTIKKEEMQAAICGLPNTGKSYLFKNLTNQETNISNIPFSTFSPGVAMMKYGGTQIQIIDMPPFPNEDKSIINTTDTLLITINDLAEIAESEKYLLRSRGIKIWIYTKIDLLNETEKRKLEATIKSKYKNYNIFVFSNEKQEDLEKLKKIIFETFPVIRVYTKEPKKESTGIPMIMKKNSTTKDVAEKIVKGLSKKIKKTRIWGPSSKFPGQTVGLEHKLQDKDTVEFQTE